MRRLAVALAFAVVSSVALTARADDTQPPLIHHSPVSKATKGDSVSISAQMEDESEIFAPTLYFRYPGARGYSSVAMTRKGDAFVASVQATADIEYWIEAYDEFGNGPTREGTPDRPHKVAVAEKAKVMVQNAPPPKPVEAPRAPEPEPAPMPEPAAPASAFDANATADNLQPPPPPPDLSLMPPTEIIVPADDERPIYKEWWFIGGAGVVVAGAVVAGVILGSPDPVYRNTFGASFKRP